MSTPDQEQGRNAAETLPRRFGKYELLEKIGAGGMAEIFRARMISIEGFEKLLVVKRILPGFAANRAFVKMLIDEAKIASSLQHPNVVQIFDLGQVDGQYFIAMEHVHGRDLLKVLARCVKLKVRLPLKLTLHVVAEISKGLAYAHTAADIRGEPLFIIHRDVSPSNVLIAYSGDVKLTDFGVARARTQQRTTRSGVLRGKLGYMSPEQVAGHEVDYRSDIFSLGTILFEAVTLKRLFLGKSDLETLINIRDVRIDHRFARHRYVPTPLVEIMRKALAREPAERFQSALEFHDAIADFMYDKRLRVHPSDLADFVQRVFADDPAARLRMPAPSPVDVAIQDGVDMGEEGDLAESESSVGEFELRSERSSPGRGESDELGAAPSPGEPVSAPVVAAPREPSPLPPVENLVAPRTPAVQDLRASTGPTFRAPSSALFEVAETSEVSGEIPEVMASRLAGETFRLRDSLGNVFGPISFHNLIGLIKARTVMGGEMLSISGGEWRPAETVPGLRELHETLFPPERHEPMFSGEVNHLDTPRLLYRLWSQKYTGKLTVSYQTTRKEVFVAEGRPRYIASTLKGELLGAFLVARKLVTEEQMQTAVQRVTGTHERIGDALIQLGHLRHHQLFQAFQDLHHRKFTQLFVWKSGHYAFHERSRPPRGVVLLDLDTPQAIAEGVREFYGFEELKRFFNPYYPLRVVPVRDRRSRVRVQDLRFNPQETRFLGRVEDGGTLAEILRDHARTNRDAQTLLRVLFLLLQMDLVRLED